jgi:hypothetical protein
MHDATTAGSDNNGHTVSGGAAMVISSRIEIIEGGYRYSSALVDIYGSRRRGNAAFGATSPSARVSAKDPEATL